MKEKNRISSFLVIIAVLLFTILYLDNALSETKIPKIMLLVKSLTCSASESNEVRLSKQDSGKEITVKVGDVIQIELKRFGSTGYEWYFDKPYSEYFELIREDTEEISCEGIVGTPVIRTWGLRALKKGETEVKLYLYRVWEGKDKAVDVFKLKVKIL